MRSFIDPTFTEDGDSVPSGFMREVGLSAFEPGCIEALRSPKKLPIRSLLSGASYGDQWVAHVPEAHTDSEAIIVFAPNQISSPESSSLTYLGEFEYRP